MVGETRSNNQIIFITLFIAFKSYLLGFITPFTNLSIMSKNVRPKPFS